MEHTQKAEDVLNEGRARGAFKKRKKGSGAPSSSGFQKKGRTDRRSEDAPASASHRASSLSSQGLPEAAPPRSIPRRGSPPR